MDEITETSKTTQKKYRRLKIFAAIAATAIAAVAIGIFLHLYLTLANRCIKSELTVEINDSCPSVGEFLNWENEKAYFTSEINDETVMTALGDYEVSIYLYWHEKTATLHVVDTTPPEVQTKNISIMHGDSVSLDDFIVSVNDSTETSIDFTKEPDLDYEGTQTVTVEAVDAGGNVTLAEASLTIEFDHEAPVISGVEEITITEGDSVSYKKGVTVTDNIDQDVKLNVNADNVDTDTPGDYEVIYSAVDRAGNKTEIAAAVHVLTKAVAADAASTLSSELTEEYIYELADAVLADILTDGMTMYEQAEAIYWYCHAISFTSQAARGWLNAAYQGFVKRKGDCYIYAITAQVLLTRAGIPNFLIQRIETAPSDHYWNAIDVGEGWHHFDSSWHTDGSITFYMTDAESQEYSSTHRGYYYDYDKSLYPEIP